MSLGGEPDYAAVLQAALDATSENEEAWLEGTFSQTPCDPCVYPDVFQNYDIQKNRLLSKSAKPIPQTYTPLWVRKPLRNHRMMFLGMVGRLLLILICSNLWSLGKQWLKIFPKSKHFDM